MKKILLTIALVACGVAVFAQGGSLSFLRVDADARTAAMGNAFMGEATGMYLYSNPTSFLQDSTNRFYGAYTFGLLPKAEDNQIFYHGASFGYKHGKQAFMLGMRALHGAEVAKMSASGTMGKPIKPYDYALDLSYTRDLGGSFSAYVTGTFVQSYIGKAAFTGSASGGVYYRGEFDDVDYTVGLGFYNLGAPVKYGNSEYDQPTSVGLGGSFACHWIQDHRLNFSWTARYYVLPEKAEDFVVGLGAEYQVIEELDVRAGYYLEDRNSRATVGLGYNMKQLSVNLAYQIATEKGVDNSLFLGLSMKF